MLPAPPHRDDLPRARLGLEEVGTLFEPVHHILAVVVVPLKGTEAKGSSNRTS